MLVEMFHDHFQNYKSKAIPKAQLIIADIPYNLAQNAYASNPSWYKDGDNKNGESELAGKSFFDTDKDFKIPEFMHFVNTMLKKEPKEKGQAGCMIVFCEFEQQFMLIEKAKEYGFNHYINLVFRKNYSAQVLKANMKVVGNCEYAVLLYREKLPRFNNFGKMIFNCLDYQRDTETPKIHPCLPCGELVFINGQWMAIEDVSVGDRSEYGVISEVSAHIANKLYEIKSSDGNSVRATGNHPFLVLAPNGDIAWKEAHLLRSNEIVLHNERSLKCIQQSHQRAIEEFSSINGYGSNINMYGNKQMAQYHKECAYTTSIKTSSTIELKTCNLSRTLNTSGYTVVAKNGTEFGTSNASHAENGNHAMINTGISIMDGCKEQTDADYVQSNTLPPTINLTKRNILSVKEIEQDAIVYNLSVDGIPAFDTLIGVSHNTQKSIHVIKNLIEIFTDIGDVVIDPCAGSGVTLIAAEQLGRRSYGFEIKKEYVEAFKSQLANKVQRSIFNLEYEQIQLQKITNAVK